MFSPITSESWPLSAELELGKSRLPATVMDFTDGSARVRVREHIAGGTKLTLRVTRAATGVEKQLPAYVVWHKPQPDGDTHLGLKFAPLPDADLKELMAPCAWRISGNLVEMRGDFVESVDFAPLLAALAGAVRIEIDLLRVRRLNSVGSVRWMDLVHALRGRDVHFQRCSLEFINHAAMSTGMIGDCVVDSVMAPFLCAGCGKSEDRLVDIPTLRASGSLRPRPVRCDTCGKALEFDDIPERYFSFLD